MSGFVANADAESPVIVNDDWWPDVDPTFVRQVHRFDGTVTDERLREALTVAIGSVNGELVDWRATQTAAGYTRLVDVPASKIDGTSRYVDLYQRAVRCTAAAHIVERYRNYSATNDGEKKAEEQTSTIDELRRDARWAIRDILGLAHTTVELI